MFARMLLFILVVLAGVFIYLAFAVDSSYAPYFAPFLILLAVVFIFSPQINWWYHKKYPIEIDEPIQKILNTHLAFYRNLSPEDKKKFNIRLSEFVRSKDWKPMVIKRIPDDIKAIIGASAIMLTFDKEEHYLFEDYENIILYKSSFYSPHYKKYRHASETNFNDKCLIFSMQHIILAFRHEGQYYDLALHEFAKIYGEQYPEERPVYDEDIVWDKIEALTNYNLDSVQKFIGLELDDVVPVIYNSKYHFDNEFMESLG